MRIEGSLERNRERNREDIYGQEKKAAKRAVDKARRDMEADACSKLDEVERR